MTKRVGFLDKRLGTIVVYCNRTKTSGLWYVRNAKGENVPVESPSFQSVEGGMRGLQIYEVTRGGKEGLKIGLILEGDDNQVYKFETSIDTAFARGMLWAIAQMTEEDIRSGQIGINPTPADPARSDSDNAGTILYCNMFVNGVEMSYMSNSQDIDWQQVAQKALSLANKCDYPIAQVPQSGFFLDQKQAQKTSQPARQQTTQGRSGVSYPQQTPRGQAAPANNPSRPVPPPSELQSVSRNTIEPTIGQDYTPEEEELSEEELSLVYDDLMLSMNEAYAVNGMQIDENRMKKVLDYAKVSDFTYLWTPRKHQIVTTLAKELVEAKQANHSAVGELNELIAAKPVNSQVFEKLKNVLLKTFGVTPDSSEAGASNVEQQTTKQNFKDSDIPF